MAERPKFFDDLAGVAGGALSALAGLREEGESMVYAAIDDTIRRLDLVRRSELEAVQELAANARTAQEAAEAAAAVALASAHAALQDQVAAAQAAAVAAETRAQDAEQRLAALEHRVAALETRDLAAPPADAT